MEGHARVVVEFADSDTAMACYRSAEYQIAKTIRQQYADADFIVVEGARDLATEARCAAVDRTRSLSPLPRASARDGKPPGPQSLGSSRKSWN
jgi:hypothetical protein